MTWELVQTICYFVGASLFLLSAVWFRQAARNTRRIAAMQRETTDRIRDNQ